MQIKDQWKQPRNWKVIAGAGTLAAVGITGLALAGPIAADADDDVIELEERAQITQTTVRAPLPADGIIDRADLSDDRDSPFDDAPRRGAGADDSPASDSPSPDSPDSPAPAAPPPDAPDSPDPSPQDSPDNPASPDAPEPGDSGDTGSWDSSGDS